MLASASPRRARILRELGIAFRVVVSHQDEALHPGEDGAAAVERLARAKASAVAAGESLPVLAADTEVLLDGHVLGKPRDDEDAVEMLRRLAGRSHEVVTGVCLVAGGTLHSSVERSVVSFAPMSESELRWYAATGEPLDKAGGYHVDGKGALFIETVAGSPSNVAGLPVRTLLFAGARGWRRPRAAHGMTALARPPVLAGPVRCGRRGRSPRARHAAVVALARPGERRAAAALRRRTARSRARGAARRAGRSLAGRRRIWPRSSPRWRSTACAGRRER